jgi:hypothetical protein
MNYKSRILKIFNDISINEIIMESCNLYDDIYNDKALIASFYILPEEKDIIFSKYFHLKKHENINDLNKVLIDEIPFEYEFDYYYLKYNEAVKGIIIKKFKQRNRIIVFTKEKDGRILILLYGDKSNWGVV